MPFITLNGQLFTNPEEIKNGLYNLVCAIRNDFDKSEIKSYIELITFLKDEREIVFQNKQSEINSQIDMFKAKQTQIRYTGIFDFTEMINDLRIKLENEKKKTLEYKNKYFAEKARYQKLLKTIHNKEVKWKRIQNLYCKYIRQLNEKIKKLEAEKAETLFENEFLEEIVKGYKFEPSGRRYSERTKNICFVLHSHSAVCYQILRKYLPTLPSEETLRVSFRSAIKSKKENLLNLDQLKLVLDELYENYKKDNEMKGKLPCVIASDAATMDPTKTGDNAIFAIGINPLKKECKPKIINILPSASGKLSEDIVEHIKNVIKITNQSEFCVKYIALDGDNGGNILFKAFFDYLSNFKGKTFDDFMKYVDEYSEPIPISDWLHLLKNFRSRLVSAIIHAFNGAEGISINSFKDMPNLKNATEKTGPYDSMRDDYALVICSLTTIMSAIENHEYSKAITILPHTLMNVVLLSHSLSKESRILLIQKSLEITKFLYEQSKLHYKSYKSKRNLDVCLLNNSSYYRIISTMVAFAHALCFYSENLSMDRLGTHLIEFFFGRMRRAGRGDDSSDRLITSAAIAELCSEKETFNARGRFNISGVPINIDCNGAYDNELFLESIEEIKQYTIADNKARLRFSFKKLYSFITQLSEGKFTKIPNLKGNAGAVIFSRLSYKPMK